MGTESVAGSRRVVVLGTGGTISGRAASAVDNIGYVAGEVGVAELLVGIDAPPSVTLLAEQVAQVDSKDMEFSIWRTLEQRCLHWLADASVVGIVITHGTDTLEETAFYLHSVLPAAKPVVITCAMRPASSLSPDGPQNVRDAVAVAATQGAQGVMAVCAGVVHSAVDVQKVHTYRLDAFSSGDAGPVGYVEEGEVRRVRPWPEPVPLAPSLRSDIAPRVEVVMSHANARGWLVDLLLQERTNGAPHAVQGLVLAATGSGTLHHELEDAAARAMAAGVQVVRATRCAQGRIFSGKPSPIPDAGALTPAKARVAMMVRLLTS